MPLTNLLDELGASPSEVIGDETLREEADDATGDNLEVPSPDPPGEAEFQVDINDLEVDPTVTEEGDPIVLTTAAATQGFEFTFSIEVENVGSASGEQTIDANENNIDDFSPPLLFSPGDRSVELDPGETEIIEFDVDSTLENNIDDGDQWEVEFESDGGSISRGIKIEEDNDPIDPGPIQPIG